MMTGVVFFLEKVRKLYNSKYQNIYSKRYYFLKNDYIKDTRICWIYSGIRIRATRYVYLNGSPYCGAEGSSQLKSCLHFTIIHSAPRIGRKIDKLE